MPIFAIKDQPGSSQLKAAYRPIIFLVNAVRTDGYITPPVMYCDIYFNNIFYKTISKTQWKQLNDVGLSSNTSDWEFDIQDAAQEYLKKYIAGNGMAMIVQVDLLITKCFCRFRSSGINTGGFIESENMAPVQATSSTAAVAGTGTQSNTFFILNSALQHEDNQDLAAHLNEFKKKTWDVNAWPLTHRPSRYKLRTSDSDFFPIVYIGNDSPFSLTLNYRLKGQTTWRTKDIAKVAACPVLSNFQINPVNNGTGGQTINFSWDPFPAGITSVLIEFRAQGSGGSWGSAVFTTSPQGIIQLLGLYEIRVTTQGSCVAAPVLYENVGVPSTPCTGAGISGSPSLPDAVKDLPYSSSINLTGTAPFALSNVTKPSWMTITIVGSTVQFSGTPATGDVGTGITVSFRASNCYSGNHVDFSDTIDVTAVSNNNVINVEIFPGTMDTIFTPSNCWQWEGTVSIKDHTGTIIITRTWSSHTDQASQDEFLQALNLVDGTYTVEWNLNVRQACSSVSGSVDYARDGGGATSMALADSQSFSLSGNTTTNLQLAVNAG